MPTLVIAHNDYHETMEEIAREIFGDSVSITSCEGGHGENLLHVSGDSVNSHSIEDIERMEWVISAELL